MIPHLSFILNQINDQLPPVSIRAKRAAPETEDLVELNHIKKFKTKEFSILAYESELFAVLREYNHILDEQLALKASLKETMKCLSDDELTKELYAHPKYLEWLEKLYPVVDKINKIYALVLQHISQTSAEMNLDCSN